MSPQMPSPAPSPPLSLPLALIQEINRLADRFEAELRAGKPTAPVGDLFSRVPHEGRAELLRQLVRAEADHRREQGRPLTAAEANARYAPLGSWVSGVLNGLGLDDVEPLTLTVVAGSQVGRKFQVAANSNCLVGRGPAGVNLAMESDQGMSRAHFMIEYNPPVARLADMRSKNKTRVNGAVVEQIELSNGDEIKAGQTTFAVSMPAPAEHTMTISGQVARAAAKAGDAATSPATVTPQPAGSTLDLFPGYVPLEEIARGGMGVVYRAFRSSDGLVVALKRVHPTVAPRPDVVARFTREVAILKKLSHPNIVAYLDAGEAGGMLYFAMEYIEGESAGTHLKRHGPFALPRVVTLGCQLLDALGHAHAHGIVHRDVKPSNVLLSTAYGPETLKLADFGLARTYQGSAMSGLTMTGTPGGTPGYMPPEQVLDFRSARPAADQYAAAATLYHLLTGQAIYEPAPTTMDMMMRILNDEPIPLRPASSAALPAGFAEVIRRALSRDAAKRYPDINAMRAALAKCAKG
jgi:serine/threonine-protein kinase